MSERSHRLGDRDRYGTLLSVGQAANSARELDDVLARTAQALEPFVPLDSIGVNGLIDGQLIPRGIHIADGKRGPGEGIAEVISRITGHSISLDELKVKVEGSMLLHLAKTREIFVCEDVRERPEVPGATLLASLGVRTMARAALVVRETPIGSIHYSRFTVNPFTPEQISVLQDVTPLIATALANALAYEEIKALKNQLEQENLVLREEVATSGMFEEIVGSSKALRQVIAQIEKVAPTDSTVLITGETGVGKELIARAVHKRSPRADQPMVKVSCASLPSTLIASELFGHEKGAFTGAGQRRIGRFELAASGSIFLDEVGELPPEIQVSLLRVIQEREFERVGGAQTIRTNARVITATNRDLKAAAAEGRFRSDLYYRLNVFPIEVPPLRKRREDIPVLVEYFAARHGSRIGKKFKGIDKNTMERLVAYDWPGNVRECANLIERAAILSDGPQLEVDERLLVHEAGNGNEDHAPPTTSSGPVLRRQERELIERALAQCGGRVSGEDGAAKRLGIPSSTLESKIKKLGIDKFRFRSGPRAD